MTTVKLTFRPPAVAGQKGTLCYQLTGLGRSVTVATAHRIYAGEWDGRHSCLRADASVGERGEALQLIRSCVEWELPRLRRLLAEGQPDGGMWTAASLREALRLLPPYISVFAYVSAQIECKRRMQCLGTARSYANVLRSFSRFRCGRDLGFNELTAALVQEYEAWMLHAGLRRNSVACYLRTLRTLVRRAVDEGVAADTDAFRRVRVSIGRTAKRAVPIPVIRAIRSLDLTERPSLRFARDVFMFSFYTRGMSFVDIAHLRRSNLRAGFLTYSRCKTFQCLTIRWEPPMQQIVDRYAPEVAGAAYLFPILCEGAPDNRRRYEQTLQRVNRSLKKIGDMLGLDIPLTTYVARHSWASIARRMDVPLSVISEGLGHDSDRTTQIYLASLDTSMVNRANRKIISKITDAL
ncbi:MAG: site-specific integrase [Clostridium sp.]|nr:site-specific integrase [Clostridium sp.]